MKKVKSVTYNFRQVGSTICGDGASEDWERYTVGISGVVSIQENQSPTHTFNYVVEIEDGTSFRIFNPNFVEYFPICNEK